MVANSPLGRFVMRHGELELELSVLSCDETTSSGATRTFECDLEGSEAIMRAADLQGHATWIYVIVDGRIIESSPPFFDNGAEIAQVHGALAGYLRDVDRDGFENICNGGYLDFFDARLGPDCTAFIRGHLDGFAMSNAASDS